MVRNFLFSWKKKKLILIVALLSYFLCITIMSILLNQVAFDRKIAKNVSMGYEENYSVVDVKSNKGKNIEFKTVEILDKYAAYGKVDVLGLGNSSIGYGSNHTDAEVCPTLFYKKPDWTPALIKGRYMTVEESAKGLPVLLLGKNTASIIKADLGSEVDFYGKKYKVIGILGMKYFHSDWDNSLVISLKGLPPDYITEFEEKTMKADNNGSKVLDFRMVYRIDDDSYEKTINQANKELNNSVITTVPNTTSFGGRSLFVDIQRSMLITIPIIIVAVLNVINISLLWVMDRKREITIKKALGATDALIIKKMRNELMSIVVIAIALSFIVQKLLEESLESILFKLELSLQFSMLSFIISIIVSLGIGYLTTIIPARKILLMEPCEALRYE